VVCQRNMLFYCPRIKNCKLNAKACYHNYSLLSAHSRTRLEPVFEPFPTNVVTCFKVCERNVIHLLLVSIFAQKSNDNYKFTHKIWHNFKKDNCCPGVTLWSKSHKPCSNLLNRNLSQAREVTSGALYRISPLLNKEGRLNWLFDFLL